MVWSRPSAYHRYSCHYCCIRCTLTLSQPGQHRQSDSSLHNFSSRHSPDILLLWLMLLKQTNFCINGFLSGCSCVDSMATTHCCVSSVDSRPCMFWLGWARCASRMCAETDQVLLGEGGGGRGRGGRGGGAGKGREGGREWGRRD